MPRDRTSEGERERERCDAKDDTTNGYKKISLTIRSWYINFHLMENIFMDVHIFYSFADCSPRPHPHPQLDNSDGRCFLCRPLGCEHRSATGEMENWLCIKLFDQIKINTNVMFVIILLLICSLRFCDRFNTAHKYRHTQRQMGERSEYILLYGSRNRRWTFTMPAWRRMSNVKINLMFMDLKPSGKRSFFLSPTLSWCGRKVFWGDDASVFLTTDHFISIHSLSNIFSPFCLDRSLFFLLKWIFIFPKTKRLKHCQSQRTERKIGRRNT